jgi:signal transduction histidine kinase
VIGQEERLRGLLEAGIALSSELSLDALLQKLVEIAAELSAARYAALGVIDPTGRELERFVTTGIDPETVAEIGDLPRGRGILGVLIREAKPLRLHDLSEDARSVGFPPRHPPMQTFLGVPILLRGVAYGNLYLTEKENGLDFTEDDEEIATLLAGQAAVAIENARLYESATRWSRQLESLNDVGNALVTEMELPRLLDLVAKRLQELIAARLVAILLPTPGADLEVRAAAGDVTGDSVDMSLYRETTKSGRVMQRKMSERVDFVLEDPEIDQTVARRLGARAALYVPLIARDRAIGVILVVDRSGTDPRFSADDLRLAEAFASRAAVAVDLSERVAGDSLRRVFEAQELERRRLALELHDETGQALTSVLLGLRSIEEAVSDEMRVRFGELRELVVGTLQNVRQLAVQLRPKVLDDFGLGAALERLTAGFAEQTGIAVDLESRLPNERLPSEVETALYRIVQEALTNVAKHAQAKRVSLLLTRAGRSVSMVIEDDGRGFTPEETEDEGLGLIGIQERVALLRGRFEIESAKGGTTLVVEVPVP